jgi:hypothetical protein
VEEIYVYVRASVGVERRNAKVVDKLAANLDHLLAYCLSKW